MAALKHLASGLVYPLPAVAHIGRHTTCELRLDSPMVSQMHGRLSWNGRRWEVRDLQSSNGTFVNGERISSGSPVPLRCKSRLAFGDPEDGFEFVDDSAPTVAAEHDGVWIFGTSESLELPSSKQPICVIYSDNGWFLERFDRPEDDPADITNGAKVEINGQLWCVHLPLVPERTLRPGGQRRRLVDIAMRIEVSKHGEHVSITYVHAGVAIPVRPRSHGQLLLYLAELRMRDAARGDVAESEHGWCYRSDVASALGVDGRQVSLHMWRAKDQARSEAEIEDFVGLIETRPDSSEIRIGIRSLDITR